MSMFAVFGIGIVELIVLAIGGIVVVAIVGVIIALLAGNQGRRDRKD